MDTTIETKEWSFKCKDRGCGKRTSEELHLEVNVLVDRPHQYAYKRDYQRSNCITEFARCIHHMDSAKENIISITMLLANALICELYDLRNLHKYEIKFILIASCFLGLYLNLGLWNWLSWWTSSLQGVLVSAWK